MSEVGGRCMICSESKAEGIRILSGFICSSCEGELVKTDVRDARYPFFIHQMKQILVEHNV